MEAYWLAAGSFIRMAEKITLLTHFPLFNSDILWQLIVIDLIYTAVFLPWGMYLYSKNNVEYNGLLLVFPSMQTFFTAGITICFALLGGSMSTVGSVLRTGDTSSLTIYYLSTLIVGGLAYLLTKKLLKQPIRIGRKV